METKSVELDNTRIDLSKLVADTARAFAIQAQQKGLSLDWEVSPEIPSEMMGDPASLRQILVNLLGNALKFTPAGSVSVRATVEARDSQEIQVRFTVTDTGIGIPLDKQGVIFQPFAQADGSMTRKYGGTGLGLSISMRLVELMGGRIGVESEPGKGSTFHFSVRFKPPQAERHAEPESHSEPKNLAIAISPLS